MVRHFLKACLLCFAVLLVSCDKEEFANEGGARCLYNLKVVFEDEEGRNLADNLCTCTLPQMNHEDDIILIPQKLQNGYQKVEVIKDRRENGEGVCVKFCYITHETTDLDRLVFTVICERLFGDMEQHEVTSYFPEKNLEIRYGYYGNGALIRCSGISIDGGEMLPTDSVSRVTVRLPRK